MNEEEALKIVVGLAKDAFRHRLLSGEHGDSSQRITDMAFAIAMLDGPEVAIALLDRPNLHNHELPKEDK